MAVVRICRQLGKNKRTHPRSNMNGAGATACVAHCAGTVSIKKSLDVQAFFWIYALNPSATKTGNASCHPSTYRHHRGSG